MIIKNYRIKERKWSSLEGSTFYHYSIQKRRFRNIGIDIKWFWKDVIDESKTNFELPNFMEYPYIFDTRKEANDFIINELIGKSEYREKIIDEILK